MVFVEFVKKILLWNKNCPVKQMIVLKVKEFEKQQFDYTGGSILKRVKM